MGFKYEERSSEDISRRSKQQSGAYDNFLSLPNFKARSGENVIRILPWLNGERKDAKAQRERWGGRGGFHWGIDILVHYGLGPDEQAYLCLKMNGAPCPACDARAAATDEKERNKLQPTTRVLAWLVDRDEERAGPQPWAMPLKLSKDISKRSVLRGEGGWLSIDHPEKGHDIIFDKTGEKLKTQYERAEVVAQESPLAKNKAQAEEWLNYVDENFLPDLLEFFPYDHIEQVLYGTAEKGEGVAAAEAGPGERAETVARGRRSEPDAEQQSSRPRRATVEEEAPQERTETVARGRRGEAEASGPKEDPPWKDRTETAGETGERRDRAAESTQEGKEAASSTVRYTPATAPAMTEGKGPATADDDDRSSEAAKERLARFRERRRG